MKKLIAISFFLFGVTLTSSSQVNPFHKLDFLIGKWSGEGSGFGNNKSIIESSFQYSMDGMYIEVMNDSKFEPTERKPEGEHHIDKGFISYDKSKKQIVFRQFNIEGFVNQYVLNDSLSSDSLIIFETEVIENFVPGGKARWTIRKLDDNQIKTTFDVSFPGKEYSCYGINILRRQ